MMKYNTYTLSNGLRVIHLESVSPVVYCGYVIAAGTRDEEVGQEGLAHFCEHVTFKGTHRRHALQVVNCLERVGGDMNAFTTKEDTVYYAAILKEHFPKAVDVLSDIVFHSIYPQSEIDKEVEVICDEIDSYQDSPSELIFDDFENLIFAHHPLGRNILGNAERVRTFRTEDALSFTRKYYIPTRAVFFVYGDVDRKRVASLLERATTDVAGRRKVNDGAHTPDGRMMESAALPAYVPRHEEIQKGTHQAHVMIGNRGYRMYDDRRIVLYLLNNIMGGPGMTARLNVALREKRGLVYTVESTMVNYSDTGMWSTYFGCDSHDVERCLRLVRKELDKMCDKLLSERQLYTAKQQIKGQLGVASDNRENFAIDFGRSFLHYGVERNLAQLFDSIDRITPEQVRDIAREIFDDKAITTLIYR